MLWHKSLPPNKVRGEIGKRKLGGPEEKAKSQGCENTQGERFYGSVLIEVILKRTFLEGKKRQEKTESKKKRDAIKQVFFTFYPVDL